MLDSADRAGAPVQAGSDASVQQGKAQAFVAASRRMAKTASRPMRTQASSEPGEVLAQLLDFADAVAASQPPRPAEPLSFPSLHRLRVGNAPEGALAAAARRTR